jgi:saccharopine dehydrogenase (NADP+, L-glutamate forming)
MAGQGTAKFLQGGRWKYIPYQQLFKRTTSVSVPGYGEYEGYANRDSLKYLNTYGLQGIQTMLRGTLRNKGYCSAWNVLVQLGCCDDTYVLENIGKLTHRDFITLFLEESTQPAEELVCQLFGLDAKGEEMKRLMWSGFFADEKIGLDQGTPAQVVEHILQKRWKLQRGDQDFIVMWHRFGFETHGRGKREIQAYLTCTGQDENNTAMAQTVGLPLAIATKLLLQGKIKSRGVVIPVIPEFYNPILEELGQLQIKLHEVEKAG